MSCEHCTMRDVRYGNTIASEGVEREYPPHDFAQIIQEHDMFWLTCRNVGWYDKTTYASIPVTNCPWCGDVLDRDGQRVEVRDD